VALKKSFPLNYRGKCVRNCRNKWTYAITDPSREQLNGCHRLIQPAAIDEKSTIWDFPFRTSQLASFLPHQKTKFVCSALYRYKVGVRTRFTLPAVL
jgi:hypothetical protein